MSLLDDLPEKKQEAVNHVYYFTGTGNSYHVAKRVACCIDASLIPIVSLQEDAVIEADLLCFVFPVYDFKPPGKVIEILEKLKKISAKHVIAIATYGVALSSTMKHMKIALRKKGIILTGGYGIKMPHNAVGSIGFPDDETLARIQEADQRIGEIVEDFLAGKVLPVEKTSIWEDMTMIKQLPHIARLVAILIFKGPKSLEFMVTEDCVRCRQCVKICPAGNIEWVNGKPLFGECCASCFACLQWCPGTAIHFGEYSLERLGIKHYHHPDVNASELFRKS